MSVKAFIGIEFATEAQARLFHKLVNQNDDRTDPLLAAEKAIRETLGDVGEGYDENGDSYANPVYLDVCVPDLDLVVAEFIDRPTTATDHGTIVIEPGDGLA